MNWTAIFGQFSEKNNEIIFKGKKVTKEGEDPKSDIATLISDQFFSGGRISAEVMFKEISNAFATQCEIILYFDPNTRNIVTAGLGGSFSMYSIRSFTNKWENHGLAGNYLNLKPNRFYKLDVTLNGSTITLSVDGIIVLNTTLPYVVPISQVGIFCLSTSIVTIKKL